MSIEDKISELLEQSKQIQEATGEDLSLTEEDLEVLSKEEISQLIENIDQLDEVSKATLAQYVSSTSEFGDIDNAAAGTAKVKAKAGGQDASDLKNTAKTGTETIDRVIKKGASMEKGEQTSVAEQIDLGDLLSGEGLTEEFKVKAATIFEAAVTARVAQEVAAIEEELTQAAVDAIAELKEGLNEKVDGYLGYVAEQWMNKNELALENGIKAEMFESFMSGMQTLFKEHYVTVPEDQLDVLESLQDELDTVKESLDEATAHNIELVGTLNEVSKLMQIEEAADGLSEMQAEKFKTLAESIAYDDEESFSTKLAAIRENYFGEKETKVISESAQVFITDAPVDQLAEEKTIKLDPAMAAYIKAIR
jgi:hypothetical protein